MTITLTRDHFIWPKGQELAVDRIIPHGGYFDDSHQYVVKHEGQDICIGASGATEEAAAL